MKQIKEYPNYYITQGGDVFSRGKKLNQYKTKTPNGTSGYMKVYLYDGMGHKTQKLIHRLVAEAYIPNPEGKRTVNHIDGSKQNNNVNNLEWATDSENVIHAFSTGLRSGKRGKDNHMSKPIEVYNLKGDLIDICDTAREADKKGYGDYRNISSVARGKRKTHNGFKFKFADTDAYTAKTTGAKKANTTSTSSAW